MYFSSEFAFINGSFNFAQAEAGGLDCYQKGNAKTLNICCRAVNEAVHGALVTHSSSEKQFWKLKIVTSLLAKLYGQQDKILSSDWTVTRDEDFFEAVTVGLPDFNKTFFYDVVKHCGLSKQLCLVIDLVSPQLAGRFLLDLLDFVEHETHPTDVMFLTDVVEFFALDSSKYMAGKQDEGCKSEKANRTDIGKDSASIEMVKKLCKVFGDDEQDIALNEVVVKLAQSVKEVCAVIQSENGTRKSGIRLWLAVGGFLNNIVSGDIVKRGMTEPGESRLQKYSRFFKRLKCLFQAEFEQTYFFFKSLKLDDTWISSSLKHDVSTQAVKDLICSWDELKTKLPSDPALEIFEGWKDQLADIALLCTSDGLVLARKDRKIPFSFPDVNNTLVLLREVESVLTQHRGSEVSSFLNEISKTRPSLEEMLAMTYQTCEQRLKFQTAAAMVDLKLHNYKESLSMLCTRPFADVDHHIDDWFGFLKQHVALLSAEDVKSLLAQAASLSDDQVRGSLTNVILVAVKKLRTDDKLAVVAHAVECHDVESLFGVKRNNTFAMKMTSVFNKIANITASDKALSELCFLAIQSPRKTLHRLLNDAVYNPGQQPLLIKLLQQMPVLCTLRDKTGQHVICHVLGEIFMNVISNKKKESSFNRLLTRLLKDRSPDETLMSPEEFMLTTILRRFPTSDGVPIETVLQLLITVLRTGSSVRWMPENQVFPLLLSLCSVVDTHRTLDPYSAERCADIRSSATECISCLEESVSQRAKDPCFSKKTKWLFNSLKELHWTTALRLHKLFSPLNSMNVPVTLKAFLQQTEQSWTYIPASGDTVSDLIAFALVSEETLSLSLSKGIFSYFPNLNDRITITLAKHLQSCTGSEWARAWRLVLHLVRNNILFISVRPAARETLSFVDMSAVRDTLATSHLFWQGMMFVARTTRGADVSRNVLICREYVGVIKTLLSDEVERIKNLEQCFTLSHLACELCFLMSEFQSQSRECLFVLALDLLSRHSKVAARTAKQELKQGLCRNNVVEEITQQQTAILTATNQTPEPHRNSLQKKMEI